MNDRGWPSLDASLRTAETLVETANAFAVALEDFDIDLPPSSGTVVDSAQLRAIAALYLASELEAAGVVAAAEDLMRLARTGALSVPLGEATPLLEAFWLARNERATAAERKSFFAGLFGGAAAADSPSREPNIEFEDRLIDLCEALYKMDELANNPQWGGVAQQARVRSATEALLDNLARSSSGITVFFAKEILDALRQALAILNHQDVKAAFAARVPADVVRAMARHLRRQPPGNFDVHVRRGHAGMTVLAWVADAAPVLRAGQRPLLGLDHPVVAAAVEWLETSLSLTEAGRESRPAPATRSEEGESAWAALAG